ncbi:MAG TPA: hypothetical protein VL049_19270 [Candidatus Dormibacteraeota bacterium]|nr:hypothetical protein [Candidatus Dormibacteraeota bacterium]
MKRRPPVPTTGPVPPTVPELVLSPELSTVFLLEHALQAASAALLAEHPTLIDDYARARDRDPVVALALVICRRSAALEAALRRFRRAVRAAHDAASSPDDNNDDLPF